MFNVTYISFNITRQALILIKDKPQQIMLKSIFKTAGLACVFCDSQTACMQQIHELAVSNIELMMLDTTVAGLGPLNNPRVSHRLLIWHRLYLPKRFKGRLAQF